MSTSSPFTPSPTELLTSFLGSNSAAHSGTEPSLNAGGHPGADPDYRDFGGFGNGSSSFEVDDDGGAAAVASIHYSRPATIFAAVCAIIFTVVGIAGKEC